jgi:hypothetical protein
LRRGRPRRKQIAADKGDGGKRSGGGSQEIASGCHRASLPILRQLYYRHPYNGCMNRRRSILSPERPDWCSSTPEERMNAVWELTRQSLAFQGLDEPRLDRSAVRIVRRNSVDPEKSKK